MEQVLGLDHPDTVEIRNNLARVYRADEGTTEADELDMR